MNKLRDDVRAAFDKEQAKLGDLAGARHRLVQNALRARDDAPSRSLQWVAGIAAVLIAAIVITTFELVRAGSQSHTAPAATPKAVVSPTPLSSLLNVADSTPIITFADPALPSQVDAMTWDGKAAGKLAYQPVGTGNPANNLFAGPTVIRDRSGQLMASGTFGAKYFGGTWADDEVHFCQMVPFDYLGANGVPATLQIVTPGSPPRNVIQVGNVYEQASISVAACSVLEDRAVVVQSFGDGGAAQYWVVQLSTGKILWGHKFDSSSGPAAVVSSRDGMYVAEHQTKSGLPITAAGSTIYGPNGNEVAHLAMWVEAFSWDGSLAVIDSGFASGSVTMMRWGDASTVWGAPSGYALSKVEPEPAGSSLAIWIASPAQLVQGSGPAQADLYVISSDGHVIAHVG
ncbi:MAG: hypothetical protein ACYDA0_11465 [Candidatus Dormibacteraceae bacterium]